MFPGERIKELREEKGLTKSFLCHQIHVSRSSMTEYEKGVTQPSMPVLLQMADFFDVSLDYLMGRTTIRSTFQKLESQLETRSGMVPVDVVFTLGSEEKEVVGLLLRLFAKRQERQKK